MPALGELSLEAQRESLIRFLEIRRPQGSSRNDVTVVFDGREDVFGGGLPGPVRVIFSKTGTADHVICRIVEERPKENWVVVTDDREIQFAVKAAGARIMKVAAFLEKGKGPAPKSGKPASPKNGLNTRQQMKINDELKNIWLNKRRYL